LELTKFLISKNLFIDSEMGMEYLSEYLNKVQQIKELGISNVFDEQKLKSDEIQFISNSIITVDSRNENVSISDNSILKMNLSGAMILDDGLCTRGVRSFSDTLLKYKNDQRVVGAVIEINSGGGESTAGEYLYTAIQTFEKPVIVLGRNIGSAAYLAASAAKEIIATSDLSKFGSIGAYIPIDKKLIEYIKENYDDVYSDLSSEKNAPIRSFLDGNKQPLKDSLNEFVIQFQNIIKANRPLKGDVENTLKGGMFLANTALERGLIDSIGNIDLAIKRIKYYSA
jgi:protease-4